jgi:hypothetical protein
MPESQPKATPFSTETKPWSPLARTVSLVDPPTNRLTTGDLKPSHRSFGAFPRTHFGLAKNPVGFSSTHRPTLQPCRMRSARPRVADQPYRCCTLAYTSSWPQRILGIMCARPLLFPATHTPAHLLVEPDLHGIPGAATPAAMWAASCARDGL